jgi:transposase
VEDKKRREELNRVHLNADGTPNHFRLLMLAVQEKKAEQQREAEELKRQKAEEEKNMMKPPPGRRMTLSYMQSTGLM